MTSLADDTLIDRASIALGKSNGTPADGVTAESPETTPGSRSAPGAGRGLTTQQLAQLRRVSVDRMEAVLVDSASLGLVECDEDGCWRLTEMAAQKFGRALGAMTYNEGERQ